MRSESKQESSCAEITITRRVREASSEPETQARYSISCCCSLLPASLWGHLRWNARRKEVYVASVGHIAAQDYFAI